jgi:hypothetical protein
MEENVEKRKVTAKEVVKNAMVYGIIVISVVASFIVGFTYHKLTNKTVISKKEIVKVRKNDVTIAIDESHHLIIINNNTGDYTVYQDSIGNTIFKLYAANVWGQHSPVINKIKP